MLCISREQRGIGKYKCRNVSNFTTINNVLLTFSDDLHVVVYTRMRFYFGQRFSYNKFNNDQPNWIEFVNGSKRFLHIVVVVWSTSHTFCTQFTTQRRTKGAAAKVKRHVVSLRNNAHIEYPASRVVLLLVIWFAYYYHSE